MMILERSLARFPFCPSLAAHKTTQTFIHITKTNQQKFDTRLERPNS